MRRVLHECLLGAGCWLALAGCAHFVESSAIERFAQSLQQQDLDGLKANTSDEFADRALRTAAALEDLKILRLPDGKVSVVDVEEISSSKRRVTVEVGEAKRELYYELVKDDSGRWVVDDIYLKQKKKGIEAYRSVSEQLDLLISVREFLEAWTHGDRQQVLHVVGPDLRSVLETLPPNYLARLTKSIAKHRSTGERFKPQASLQEDTAVVRLPRAVGELVLTLKQIDKQWVVSDVAIDAKDEHDRLPSLWKQSIAVRTCLDFLDAYEHQQRDRLQQIATDDFYRGCLGVGDLSIVKLPNSQLPDHDLQVTVRGNRVDFLLRNEREVVQITLHRQTEVALDQKVPVFQISDVTIYDVETRQSKRLAALFTSRGMLEVFIAAIADRNLGMLRHSTTKDFAHRVWEQLNADTVARMPLEQFDSAEFETVDTVFEGGLTKITVMQSGEKLTYLLRDENGRFYVDDVVWHHPGCPTSLKATLELLIPAQNFAVAIRQGRDPYRQVEVLETLQRLSTDDFNRLVWLQTKYVPNDGLYVDEYLEWPLRAVTIADGQAAIQFGDNRNGAIVRLSRERERFVIDDITLIDGPEEKLRRPLKRALRDVMASGQARPPRHELEAELQPSTETIDDLGPVEISP